MLSKRTIIFFALLIVVCLSVLSIRGQHFLHHGKLHVVFCDVGQGDGIIIKSPEGKIVLLDGGPDESFSRCLGSILPFWVRRIDLMLVTHPHLDHFAGDIDILEQYQVKAFATEDLTSDQKAYQLLLSSLQAKHVPQRILHIGDRIHIGSVEIDTVGPSEELLQRSSPHGQIGESKEFASLLLLLKFGMTSFLLPGDSQAPEVHEAVKAFHIPSVSVLQTPHHGSATGLDEELLAQLQPQLGVISVGKDNRYGHPASSTVHLFTDRSIPVKRTDQEGTIEVITDGTHMSIQAMKGRSGN